MGSNSFISGVSSWEHYEFNEIPSDFLDFNVGGNPGRERPDFSGERGPLYLGFWTGSTRCAGCGPFTWQQGFDNWSATINPEHPGEIPVTVQVVDERGGIDQQRYTIKFLPKGSNLPPRILTQPVIEASAGNMYTYDVNAIDPCPINSPINSCESASGHVHHLVIRYH